jgi:hypothetical protein
VNLGHSEKQNKGSLVEKPSKEADGREPAEFQSQIVTELWRESAV